MYNPIICTHVHFYENDRYCGTWLNNRNSLVNDKELTLTVVILGGYHG